MGRAITLFFAAIVASCLASVAIAAASPNGTTIPPATQIIDSSGNIWTVSGGIYENGVLTVHSNGVALLLYDNNTLYYKTTAGAWWSWIGKRWVTSGTPPPVNGACGTANGTAVTSAPVANLCSAGTASSVTGTGPWTWSCIGSYGGATASCSASFPTNTIPATPTGLTIRKSVV